VARLVALGAPVDCPSTKGHTPLQLALTKGPACIETICVLVELGSDVGALLAHRPMETPLHIAARCGRADVVDRLLKCPQVGSSHRHLAREASA
jgi:ankyrin repeat protein